MLLVLCTRSVCRRWFTIISHHTFGNRFLHHHGRKSMLTTRKRKRVETDEEEKEGIRQKCDNKHHHHVLLLVDQDKKELFWCMAGPCCKGPGFSMSRMPLYEGANLCVVAAWNDLILCMSMGSGVNKYKVYPTEPYFLYNPVTKQGNWLPPSPSDIEHYSTIGMICEPYLNADDLVAANSSYRYWVVFFDGKDATTKELGVHMFSSCTGKWSRFFVSSPEAMRRRPFLSTFVVGRKIYTYSSTTGILGFDPCTIDDITDDKYGKEKLVIEGHFIDWPCGFNRQHLATEIALKSCSDNESWLLMQLDFKSTTACLRVWSLEDHNNGDWWLKHSVCLQLLENYDSCFSSRLVFSCNSSTSMNLIGFHQTEGDVDDDGDVVYLMAEKRIAMCNLREGNMQLVVRIPDNICYLSCYWTTLPLWPTPLLEPTKLA